LILKAGLEAKGFRVLTAASGNEALQLCQSFDGAIDLCLTDVGLTPTNPEEPEPTIPNGLVLMQRAKDVRPDMKVLLFSGHSDEHLKRYGVEFANGQVIPKPCGLPTLVQLLHDALGTGAPLI
jgi:CheY-like chemotaxis protein